jgi:EXLDI family protein
MMPNKTIYVADADAPLFAKAQALAGGNLSAAIAQAIRQYVATADVESSEGAPGEVVLTVTEDGIPTKKRFRGHLIATQRVPTATGERDLQYRVYQSEKGKFVVWSRSGPNWSGAWWSSWAQRPETWNADWWRAETRLDIFETLEDLHGNLPDALYARVVRLTQSGSDVEDLDV